MKRFKVMNPDDVKVAADVSGEMKEEYTSNFLKATHSTGNIMLFAGDQKIEHLNDDFYGENALGKIPAECNNPEHLFRVASKAEIGVFAAQLGLIARYGREYPDVPYLVKLNSKTNLIKTSQRDPISLAMWSIDDVLDLKEKGINIVGVGYTVYLGSEFEADMISEAAQIISEAHRNGLLAVLWMYPRGKAVPEEKDGHLIAGAAGVAACLGADFTKVNPPKAGDSEKSALLLKEAVGAAGNTGVICSGGSSKPVEEFLTQLHQQIHIGGTRGNATGRNIHQKSDEEAVRMANAIAAITLCYADVETALKIHNGEMDFSIE